MKLVVNNLGSIREAEIGLDKRFYVFVGYNNSGKTQLSQLLWGILDRSFISDFLSNNQFKELEGKETIALTTPLIRKIVNRYAKFIEKTIVPEIFNIESTHFSVKDLKVKFKFKLSDFKARKSKSEIKIGIGKKKDVHLLNIEKNKDDLNVVLTKFKSLSEIKNKPKDLPVDVINKKLNNHDLLLEFILRLAFIESNSSFYLPASRLFYPIFYQYVHRVEKEKREEMTKKLLDYMENPKREKIDFKELLSFRSPYTKPMNELLGKYYRLSESEEEISQNSDLIQRLEKIVGGDLVIQKSEGISPIEFKLKIGEKNKLDMYLASSSVNQLTTLLLFFKYWSANKDNLLVIDEPEVNLHPKNQMELLDLLIRYSTRNNNKVLITTHSPLVADSINNYINLGYLKEQEKFNLGKFLKQNKINKTSKEILGKSKYGIYFFDGEKVYERESQDYGYHFLDFKHEQTLVNDLSEKITDEMYKILDAQDED